MTRQHQALSVLTLVGLLGLVEPLTAQDRRQAEPGMKVFVENDVVRVQEHFLRPGEKAAMHSHPCYILYTTQDATVRFTLPDGSTRQASGAAGAVYWHDAGSHAVENVGTTDVRNIVVEIKNCTAATGTAPRNEVQPSAFFRR